jgi:hypothetical protein
LLLASGLAPLSALNDELAIIKVVNIGVLLLIAARFVAVVTHTLLLILLAEVIALIARVKKFHGDLLGVRRAFILAGSIKNGLLDAALNGVSLRLGVLCQP